jgi:hypothetical protein
VVNIHYLYIYTSGGNKCRNGPCRYIARHHRGRCRPVTHHLRRGAGKIRSKLTAPKAIASWRVHTSPKGMTSYHLRTSPTAWHRVSALKAARDLSSPSTCFFFLRAGCNAVCRPAATRHPPPARSGGRMPPRPCPFHRVTCPYHRAAPATSAAIRFAAGQI